MSRLHVFDLDGTLLPGTSVCLELARRLGCLSEIQELEVGFASGVLGTGEFARRAHQLWRELTEETIAEVFESGPWLNGIRRVWSDIRRRGERSAVITLAPDFFASQLLTWGVDDVVASRWPSPPLTGELDVSGILAPQDKVLAVDALCLRHGLSRADCVGYGDSMSDVPLFSVLPVTVAVNADHHVREVTTLSYQGTELFTAYTQLRAVIAAPGNGGRSGETADLSG